MYRIQRSRKEELIQKPSTSVGITTRYSARMAALSRNELRSKGMLQPRSTMVETEKEVGRDKEERRRTAIEIRYLGERQDGT